jgi:hypothetical protein
VITELLLPMLDEYGDQLLIAGIDTSQPGGAQLYQAAIQWYQVREDRRGVPTLICNDVILVGGAEIPDQFPTMVEQGLASGGIEWPDFPGMDVVAAQAESQATPTPAPPVTATEEPNLFATAEPDSDDTRCPVGQEGCGDAISSTVALTGTQDSVAPTQVPVVVSRPSDGSVVRLVYFWADT